MRAVRCTAGPLMAALIVSCSLGQPSRDACTSTPECRATFGAAYYCEAESGLCQPAVTEACPEVFPSSAGEDPRAVIVGTLFDRTSRTQQARERAARLVASALNERSGIDGRPVGFLHCDASRASPAALAAHLARVGVPAIVGPSSSSNVEAVFTSQRGSGVLVISPSATARELTQIDSTPGLLWRTAPPDGLQTQVLVQELMAGDIRSLAIITRQNDTYAQGLSILLREEPLGDLRIGATPQFADPSGIDAAAAAALQDGPEAVLFISSDVSHAGAFLDAAATLPYDGVRIFLTDAAANQDLFARTTSGSSRFEQVTAIRPAAPNTIVTSEFRSNYMAAFDEDPLLFTFTAHAYDAAALVLLGAGAVLGSSETVTGAGIAEAIVRMTGGSATPQRLVGSELLSIVGALRRGSEVDVVGASGPLDYGSDEELGSATYDVLAIDPGSAAFRLMRTREATRAP